MKLFTTNSSKSVSRGNQRGNSTRRKADPSGSSTSHNALFEQLEGRQMFSAGGYFIGAEYAATAHETDAYGTSVQALLGSATSGVMNVPGRPGALMQTFHDNGAIYWSPGTGAHVVYGGIGWEYGQTANETDAYGRTIQSILGLPTSDELNISGVAGARTNTFQGGVVDWSSGTGAHAVIGGINYLYQNDGGATNYIGLPTSDETGPLGYRYQFFQNGYISWTPSNGSVFNQWSVTSQVSGNLLSINAYGTHDQVIVDGSSGNLEINLDGTGWQTEPSSVTEVEIKTFGGNDTILVRNVWIPEGVFVNSADNAPTTVISTNSDSATFADYGDTVSGGIIEYA